MNFWTSCGKLLDDLLEEDFRGPLPKVNSLLSSPLTDSLIESRVPSLFNILVLAIGYS